MRDVIMRPIITEQSLEQAKMNRYTFEVRPESNKHQIKEAVEKYFGVKVVSVRTAKIAGEMKRSGKRRLPRQTRDSKKAMVEIKEGQTIKAFETKG